MTSTTNWNGEKDGILKVDARGRVQVTLERREALLDEFDRSGMSGAAFAKHYGIKYSTFAYWLQARRRKDNPLKKSSENHFLMVSAEAPHRGAGVSVELPHGVKMTITSREDARLAAVLIDALTNAR